MTNPRTPRRTDPPLAVVETGSDGSPELEAAGQPRTPSRPATRETQTDPPAPAASPGVPPKDTTSPPPPAADAGARAPSRAVIEQTSGHPAAAPEPDLDSPEFYLNRELTWLAFCERVLHEAEDDRTPLLERVKFVAIVSSNLDEFFMKRIGGLKQLVGAGVHQVSVDGRTPQQQIDEAYERVRHLEHRKQALLPRVLKQLEEHDIFLLDYEQLSASEKTELREFYLQNVFPLVTPQAIDPAHPFPFISNLSLNLLVTLHYPDSDEALRARVKVPIGGGTPRLLQLSGTNRFVPLEQVMSNNLDLLFPKMVIDACELFHVTRNANTDPTGERADDLLSMIEFAVRNRAFARIVRVVVPQDMDSYRRGMLAAELGLNEDTDVFARDGMMRMRDLFELAGLDVPELHDPPHHPAEHAILQDAPNIFYALREAGSILLQHPYESFSTSVERFVQEASRDPKVRAIKVTLYRTSSDTKIIDYLIDAARNGKQVAVVVELQARFDEAANIRWASRLEDAGIHVTYGVMGLKTHCKVIYVVRQDYNGLKLYVHIGTGNYHAGTARMYDDVGLITCDELIGRDVTELFNYLTTGYTPKRDYRKILPAPKLLKRSLRDKIQREIELHTPDNPGQIQFKINALEDLDITRELYRASRSGVQIDLIVRDTCRLRPGVPGLSENVRVMSVVGRFLEHSRIYFFRNGGDEEYYIGSADAMMRNLEHRVEVLVPVEAIALKEELRTILDLHLSDQRSAWDMQSDGSYRQRKPQSAEAIGCQERLAQLAAKREKTAHRLKRRRPKAISGRNIRLPDRQSD